MSIPILQSETVVDSTTGFQIQSILCSINCKLTNVRKNDTKHGCTTKQVGSVNAMVPGNSPGNREPSLVVVV